MILHDTPVEQPRRIIFALGVMNEWESKMCSKQISNNGIFSGIWWEELKYLTHTYRHNYTAPGGSGKDGIFYFQIHDMPFTQQQKERTKRNRPLITSTEQTRLLGTRIGFVGISKGSAAHEALLRKGIGGTYRIADFDTFETSNNNRGSSSVDQSKMDRCAERIKSIDPSIVVEKFPDGLSEDNVSKFVEDCDIIIEGCDDFSMKAVLRREAQKLRRPLLNAASQKGMIDVERYDTDMTSQPFHLNNKSIMDDFLSPNLLAKKKNRIASKLRDSRPLSVQSVGSRIDLKNPYLLDHNFQRTRFIWMQQHWLTQLVVFFWVTRV